MMTRLPFMSGVLVFCVWLSAMTAGRQVQAQADAPGDQDSAVATVFRSAQFDRFSREGPRRDIRWKFHILSHGLSVHQRMVAHIELEIPGSELVPRASHGKLAALVQVEDEEGQRYRDFGLIELAGMKPELRKQTWQSTWEAFALPGQYKISLLLYDPGNGEHSFAVTSLRVDGLKNDHFSSIWQGLPKWEFWAPLKELRDNIFRPDIDSRLNLRLASGRRIQVEVLADLTPSDLFHGSSRFYSHFLSVALPLLKDLSQIQVANGSLNVATLDLRQRRVTFEQDNVRDLNWAALKNVVAPENGPGMIDVKGLEQKQEEPDFLRDEVLRRLEPDYRFNGISGYRQDAQDSRTQTAAKVGPSGSDGPTMRDADNPIPRHRDASIFKIFIVVGSPMDFYAFHRFPTIDPVEVENCVIYYLQYEIYGPYATGALGSVKKMLKPLPIHTIKIRTAESVRGALERIVREVGEK